MLLIHFVGCNRTNFGSEPLLMSRSLMCKSSGPSAKLIRSPHNPAQVQPCSLLHYLSCVPSSVRPPTANKPISKREIHTYMQPCWTKKKKKRKIRKKGKLKYATGTGMLWCISYLHTVYPNPVSIFTTPCKSGTDDNIIFFDVNVSLWLISSLHCFSTE